MVYLFRCSDCGATDHIVAEVDFRDWPVYCRHDGWRMKRVYTAPSINTKPWSSSEAVQMLPGASEKEKTEFLKQSERKNEASWQPKYDEIDEYIGGVPI